MSMNPYTSPDVSSADARHSLAAAYWFLVIVIAYFVTLLDVWRGSGSIAGMADDLRTTTRRDDLVILIEAAISGVLGVLTFDALASRFRGDKAARVAYAGLLVCVTLVVISIGLLACSQRIHGVYLIPLTVPFVCGAMVMLHFVLTRFEERRPLACWAILGILVATVPIAALDRRAFEPIAYGHNPFRLSPEGIKGFSVTIGLVTICMLLAWRLRAIGKTWRETAPPA